MPRYFSTGTKRGRTIYRQQTDAPGSPEDLIGLMDTRELAAFAVKAMNAALDRGEEPVEGETRQ